MVWRVLRVVVFMLRRILVYTWLKWFDRKGYEAYLVPSVVAWSALTLRVFNVELEVLGRDQIPLRRNGPRIFLSNHQGQIDIPVLIEAVQDKVGFVAKQELGRIPILSYWMRQIGCVFIDRADKAGALDSLKKAAASIGNNSLVIFPEGTRSKTGEILPVKTGGLRMAVMANAEIIPVRIRNSRNAFEAREPGSKGPIPVQVRFFPPVDLSGVADERAAWQKVKAYLEECWAAA